MTRTQLATGRVSRTRQTPALWRWDCDCQACGFAPTGIAAQHNLNAHLAHACPRTQSARDRGIDLTPPPVTAPRVLAALADPSLPAEGT